MTDPDTSGARRRFARMAGSVEAAGISGALHAVLLSAAILLLRSMPKAAADDAVFSTLFADPGARARVVLALNLGAFSVIAFLWFMAVIRRRIGMLEDRFFGTVFLGSGLLLAGSLLIGIALVATPVLTADAAGSPPDIGTTRMMRMAGEIILVLVSPRLAAVFILATSSLGALTGALPKWLTTSGRVIGVVMIVNYAVAEPMPYIFPVWVAVASVELLIRRRKLPTADEAAEGV